MQLGRYREVLVQPHVGRVLATSLWARLPQGMEGLALLLFLVPHIGYGRTGAAIGVYVATGGVSNVGLARLVDRLGARPVLIPTALGFAAAELGLAFAGSSSYLVQILLCAAAGLFQPPITSVARGLYPQLLDAEAAASIFALEATAQELVYITGPALIALIAAVIGAGEAIATTGLVGLSGTVMFAVSPALSRPVRQPGHRRLTVVGTGVLTYAAAGAGLTACFAMAEVSVVAFVGGRQASATSGVILALWSLGSMLGGVRFGASKAVVTDRALTAAIAALGGSVMVAALAPDDVVLGVLLLLGGVTIAPCLARLYTRISDVAPAGSSTEAFGWLSAAFLVGASAGSSVGGVAIDGVGARVTFVLGGLAAGIGAVIVVWSGRRVSAPG